MAPFFQQRDRNDLVDSTVLRQEHPHRGHMAGPLGRGGLPLFVPGRASKHPGDGVQQIGLLDRLNEDPLDTERFKLRFRDVMTGR